MQICTLLQTDTMPPPHHSNHTHTHNCFMALWILSGTTRVNQYQMKHSPTQTRRGHQISLSASSIYCDPWHPPNSIHALYSLFPQSISKFSLVYLLAWHHPLHTPYISSPNHYLLFAADAHIIASSFAVVPRLCHLMLVSLLTLYLGLYLVASCHTSILPFLSLPSEVPPHFPFLQARSHIHATYYFADNCCTISLLLAMIYPYW